MASVVVKRLLAISNAKQDPFEGAAMHYVDGVTVSVMHYIFM